MNLAVLIQEYPDMLKEQCIQFADVPLDLDAYSLEIQQEIAFQFLENGTVLTPIPLLFEDAVLLLARIVSIAKQDTRVTDHYSMFNYIHGRIDLRPCIEVQNASLLWYLLCSALDQKVPSFLNTLVNDDSHWFGWALQASLFHRSGFLNDAQWADGIVERDMVHPFNHEAVVQHQQRYSEDWFLDIPLDPSAWQLVPTTLLSFTNAQLFELLDRLEQHCKMHPSLDLEYYDTLLRIMFSQHSTLSFWPSVAQPLDLIIFLKGTFNRVDMVAFDFVPHDQN
jgi:hypothetical protein